MPMSRICSLMLVLGVGAKRIGLLFSGAEIDYQLDPTHTQDIGDIKMGEELFSDGERTRMPWQE